MKIPTPEPGLVISYAYLWSHEAAAGREEGVKDRPCAIVAAITRGVTGRPRVVVLPITHSPPSATDTAIEIPAAVKRHLRLDDQRSWIVVSDGNDFIWPGPDIRPTAHDADVAEYGVLPPSLFNRVRQVFLDLHASGMTPVKRTE